MRKSIALACILKNEVRNLPQLMASVEGCFDEIHFTDTGSDDGSIELIQSWVNGDNPAKTKVFLHHFTWINDFAAARNASFDPVKTDYVMWMDLDDVLSDKDKFILWRDNALFTSDFWFATYHYASDEKGKHLCSFARERVMATKLKPVWRYFVHEGIIPAPGTTTNYAIPWSVVHKRTSEDLLKDRSRNLKIFEDKKDSLDARMQYYYGKELFENGKHLEAYVELDKALKRAELDIHDRIMGMQYIVYCAMALNQPQQAIDYAIRGLQLSPRRAEFFVAIGDSYLKMNRGQDALPYFRAATECEMEFGGNIKGAIFSFEDTYKHYPRNQIAKIYANRMDMARAEKAAMESLELGEQEEARGILNQIRDVKARTGVSVISNKKKSEDIIISCYPAGLYEWDEEIYKSKGIGGSETAAVEMAYWLSRITGRQVKVFNNRKTEKVFDRVEYIPAEKLPLYCSQVEPKVNIAWRHNARVTDAPTYLWCHDLGVMGMESAFNFDTIICLSEFHKRYVRGVFGVPEEKIWVSRNGIVPERFLEGHGEREAGKVIFSSSPDRGLDRAMLVMDEVVKTVPDATLHAYYGFDNMIKMGRTADAERLQKMIAERPYVKFHGNLSQSELMNQMKSSKVWLYPTNFLETFCITALEAVGCGVIPVVRNFGALPDTLKPFSAHIIDESGDNTPENLGLYATEVVKALGRPSGTYDMEPYSWESVAREWIDKMGL